MRIARAFIAGAAVAAVLGFWSTAQAAPFLVEVFVGWEAPGTCNTDAGGACLGFAGTGGVVGTEGTRLNWDTRTPTIVDSYLAIGALPDVIGFPANVGNVGSIPTGSSTLGLIDVGDTVRTVQIRHTNNSLPNTQDFLASVTLRTLLRILSPDGLTEIIGVGTGGDLDVAVNFVETANSAPCALPSIGTPCDDVFTFVSLDAVIPFSFDNTQYLLLVQGLLDADGNPTCTPSVVLGEVDCFTQEGQANDRFVHITLFQVAVPAPASLLLLGLGMLGAGVLPIIRKLRSA